VIDWSRIAQSATQLGIVWVADRLTQTAMPKPPERLTGSSAALSEPGVRGGCPVCEIDDALWEARGKLEQVVYLSGTNGDIPKEVRPLVLLARQSMERARGMVTSLRDQVPRLASQCDETAGAIDQAIIALPEPSTMTIQQARQAAGAIEGANHQAGTLALRFYQSERDYRGHQRMTDLYERAQRENMAPDEFYRRLQEVLTDG